MACYLLHFDEPYKRIQHYLGYAVNVEKRYQEHKAGRGARITQVLDEVGIDYHVVRTWPDGDRKLERALKNQKNAWKLCPVCIEQAKEQGGHIPLQFQKKTEIEKGLAQDMNVPVIKEGLTQSLKFTSHDEFTVGINDQQYSGILHTHPKGIDFEVEWKEEPPVKKHDLSKIEHLVYNARPSEKKLQNWEAPDLKMHETVDVSLDMGTEALYCPLCDGELNDNSCKQVESEDDNGEIVILHKPCGKKIRVSSNDWNKIYHLHENFDALRIAIILEYVKKVGSEYEVVSKKGKNLGKYKSKKKAQKRLGQIEFFKSQG